ncbi:MAG: hypothetical protein MUF49_27820 [Oculatellaceae cyanobacterium Prado106]|jgi:hypothetical protein|nr:hypothetical protein [Oculatellaceae cyanobacterium Prado106]
MHSDAASEIIRPLPVTTSTSFTIVAIPPGDRWQVHQRLQELEIPCSCPATGGLWVEVEHAIAAVHLWSVVRQFTQSRQVLADWLEQCLN